MKWWVVIVLAMLVPLHKHLLANQARLQASDPVLVERLLPQAWQVAEQHALEAATTRPRSGRQISQRHYLHITPHLIISHVGHVLRCACS